ncbi:MAG: hypothetical protein ABL892_00445 [Thiobacillaceae bacterium]
MKVEFFFKKNDLHFMRYCMAAIAAANPSFYSWAARAEACLSRGFLVVAA